MGLFGLESSQSLIRFGCTHYRRKRRWLTRPGQFEAQADPNLSAAARTHGDACSTQRRMASRNTRPARPVRGCPWNSRRCTPTVLAAGCRPLYVRGHRDTSVRGSLSSGSAEFSGDSGNLVLNWGSCYGWHWCGLPGAGARPGGLAAGMLRCRAGTMAVPRAVASARHPGLLALRSASGLGLPAWCGQACPDSVQPSW